MERPGGPGDDRQCQRGEHPLPAGEAGRGQDGEHHRQVRQRHEQNRCRRQADQQRVGRGIIDVRALISSRPRATRLRSPPAAQPRHNSSEDTASGASTVATLGRIVHRRPHTARALLSLFSTRAAHAAHVIPDTASSTRRTGAANPALPATVAGHRPPQRTSDLVHTPRLYSRLEPARSSARSRLKLPGHPASPDAPLSHVDRLR